MNEEAEVIFEQALALSHAERPAFLARACAGNPALLAELTSLLDQSTSAEKFFDSMQQTVLPSMAANAAIGRTVDHYQIVSQIGDGGMGVVYRALDTRLNREVALKFLPTGVNPGQDATRHFMREARAAAALQHPNICVVHDVGETDDGLPFIAMALCDGETLKERLRKGPLPVNDAIDIARQIASGLAAAHARKIVHGDIKPGNVMLCNDGIARLLDFGLAKTIDAAITDPHIIRGTIAYMAPEQLRGDRVDERTDLWALGVVLYEMLSGTRPFAGENDSVVANSIVHDEPHSLPSRRADVPAGLTRVVDRLLQKDPKKRYARANDLLADLAMLSKSLQTAGSGRRRGAAFYGAGALALAVMIVAGFLSRQQSDNSVSDARAAQQRLTQNIAAYELYLRGRDPALFRTDGGADKGLGYLEEAVRLDPSFAAAYAGMTYLYFVKAGLSEADSARRFRLMADSVARKAVEMDPSLPEAHMAVGMAKTIGLWNLTEAEAAFRRAAELGGAPGLHEYFAKILLWRGRVEESLEESLRATREDPLSATASADQGVTLCLNGRNDEGLARLKRLYSLQPPLRRLPSYTGTCYAIQGMWRQAIDELRRNGTDGPEIPGLLGYSLARGGEREEAKRIQQKMIETWRKNHSRAFDIAVIAAGLGERDQFFEWLDRSADDLSLKGYIMYAPFTDLHSDPRFVQFRQKHHL